MDTLAAAAAANSFADTLTRPRYCGVVGPVVPQRPGVRCFPARDYDVATWMHAAMSESPEDEAAVRAAASMAAAVRTLALSSLLIPGQQQQPQAQQQQQQEPQQHQEPQPQQQPQEPQQEEEQQQQQQQLNEGTAMMNMASSVRMPTTTGTGGGSGGGGGGGGRNSCAGCNAAAPAAGVRVRGGWRSSSISGSSMCAGLRAISFELERDATRARLAAALENCLPVSARGFSMGCSTAAAVL